MENHEEMAERYIRESGKEIHSNCCATSRAPAREPGPCDCGPEPKDVLRDEPSAPTLQQVISVLEWASAGDWEHTMDCVKEALSLLAQLSPVPPSPDKK